MSKNKVYTGKRIRFFGRENLTSYATVLDIVENPLELNIVELDAAMIGSQAYYEYQQGHVADLKLNAAAVLDIDK